MKNKISCKEGFTLIELLVVVLIIGILASIALPQYQRAVQKARLTQLDTMVNAGKKNIELYVLTNGYPSSGVVSLTGQDNVADLNMPGNCNTGSTCWLDHWEVSVGVDSNKGIIQAVWRDTGIFPEYLTLNLVRDNGREWHVEELRQPAASLCQWLRERGYPGNGTAVAECQSVGITLRNYVD